LWNASDVLSYYGTIIGAIATIIAVVLTISFTQKQYQESIQPQLSMSLVEYNSWIYLKIKNTGKLPAKGIRIILEKISNNGGFDEFIPDAIFNSDFELYPEEMVQGKVAIQGGDIAHAIFPQVNISITYNSPTRKKLCHYSRIVTYQSAYAEKIIADVHMDTSSIEDSLNKSMRASVRMANYLDGRQVAPFDELNILAGESLKKDLHSALGKPTKPTMDREETIKEAGTKRRGRKPHGK
jgi:hypothetical protein